MAERAKFFDDLAGVAGGAFSAIAGLSEEVSALIRARVDETLAKLALVRREEFEVVSEVAANARAGLEAAERQMVSLEARLSALEALSVTAAGPKQAADSAAEVHDPHGASGAAGVPPSSGSAHDSEGLAGQT